MTKLQIFFQKGESKEMHFSSENNQISESVFFIYIAAIFFLLAILLLRLFQLTIVKGGYYRSLSEQNRIREITIEAARGDIIDRKGFTIASSQPPNINTHLDQQLYQKKEEIPSKRVYQSPEAISSIIGYRQIADNNDLTNDHCQYKLTSGERTGKKGVEKLFDCQLRGIPGKKLVEIDAHGNYLRTIDVIPPQTGEKIQLSLDLELQTKSYELIKDKKAAVIVTNPKTGEILASVSSPSFNSQDFEDQNNKNVQKYLTDDNKPLFNRVTEGVYPPGSLFKLVIATAALEDKVIDEKTQVQDTGTLKAGSLSFGNWYFLEYGKTDGMVDIVKAIQRSNDIFFYTIGNKTGVDNIKKWADIFGYGKKTDIGINEAEGMIPSTFWKKETLNDNWYQGDSYNLSIGQGYVGTTPLQTVLVTGVFANGGYLCTPKLLKAQTGLDLTIQKYAQTDCRKLPISDKTISLIREGMKEACSTGGTGWPLFDFKTKNGPIQVACKTGTAEIQAKSGLPDAWITVFAPFDNPEIAISVLVEEGGQGSDVGGPIAKDILKAYFERSQ